MKVQELRIGNYIKTDDDIICIVSRIETKEYTHWNSGDCFSITALELNTKDDYLNVKNDKWQPIPLTEEILLKCGFKFKKYFYRIYINEYSEFILAKENGDNIYYLCDIDINVNIKYLHQLQNLYFALTNKELNIEL